MHIIEKRVGNIIAYNQKVSDIKKLIGNRYIVEKLDIESVTQSGLMLIDSELSRSYECARVLVVGNGDPLDRTGPPHEMYWKVGDVITMERLAGRKMMLEGREHWLISQAHTYFAYSDDVVREAEAEAEAEVGDGVER